MTAFKKTASVSSQDELNADGHRNPDHKVVVRCHSMKSLKIILAVVLVAVGLGLSGYKIYQVRITKSHIVYVRALKDKWQFSPDQIRIPVNETWYLHVYNEDSYAHGFFIEPLGINTNLPAHQEVIIPIKSDQKGQFPFMCSVICGGGHYRMTGRLVVF